MFAVFRCLFLVMLQTPQGGVKSRVVDIVTRGQTWENVDACHNPMSCLAKPMQSALVSKSSIQIPFDSVNVARRTRCNLPCCVTGLLAGLLAVVQKATTRPTTTIKLPLSVRSIERIMDRSTIPSRFLGTEFFHRMLGATKMEP